MKYFVQYPLQIECGLKCPYCFHIERWIEERDGVKSDKYKEKTPFTFEDYKKWRDKHLSDGTEFLTELHSGEISYGGNQELAISIIDSSDKEMFQLQTNGLGSPDFYEELTQRKAKIDRIGFTFHRKPISEWEKQHNPKSSNCAICPLPFCYKKYTFPASYQEVDHCPLELERLFRMNVMQCHNAGMKVIVKELLIPELKTEILKNKEYWESQKVEFRIQDFRLDNGFDPLAYTSEEVALIHSEYLHGRQNCSCREGYKNVILRGCDCYSGDVLACWHDQAKIGSIVEDTYNPNYTVGYTKFGGIEVSTPGVKKRYHGGFYKDLWTPEIAKKFPYREKSYNQYFKGVSKMADIHEGLLAEFQKQLQEVDGQIQKTRAQLDELTYRRIRVEGAIDAMRITMQEMDKNLGAEEQIVADAPPVKALSLEDVKKEKKSSKN